MHLFIVTSVVHSYLPSVFTPIQRFEQLIYSLESIRKKVNDSYIVVIEGSLLSNGEKKVLSNYSNYIYEHNVLGIQKSLGEATLIQHYFQSNHFKEIRNEITTISKLSGRYVLTSDFDFSSFDEKLSIIKTYSNVYDTRYYRFHINSADYFISKLENVKKTLHLEDIEHSFFRNQIFPNETLFHPEKLGVAGQIAPTGKVQID